jgi:hypothetical protein
MKEIYILKAFIKQLSLLTLSLSFDCQENGKFPRSAFLNKIFTRTLQDEN